MVKTVIIVITFIKCFRVIMAIMVIRFNTAVDNLKIIGQLKAVLSPT